MLYLASAQPKYLYRATNRFNIAVEMLRLRGRQIKHDVLFGKFLFRLHRCRIGYFAEHGFHRLAEQARCYIVGLNGFF
jgi:hypothetical protein